MSKLSLLVVNDVFLHTEKLNKSSGLSDVNKLSLLVVNDVFLHTDKLNKS